MNTPLAVNLDESKISVSCGAVVCNLQHAGIVERTDDRKLNRVLVVAGGINDGPARVDRGLRRGIPLFCGRVGEELTSRREISLDSGGSQNKPVDDRGGGRIGCWAGRVKRVGDIEVDIPPGLRLTDLPRLRHPGAT